MDDYSFNPKEIINARERFNPPPKRSKEQVVDIPITEAVGKTVYLNDPRVIKTIANWNRKKDPNRTEPDNYLKDPQKVKELKKALE